MAVLFLRPDKTLYLMKQYDSAKTCAGCLKEPRVALGG